MKLTAIYDTFGLPPTTHVSDSVIINSMPVIEIVPCRPHFDSGLNLFRVIEDQDTYSKILKNHGFTTPYPIKLAFIADNFPTDSFVNDYGETFLQKFTDVASQGMSQIAQMTGSQTGTEAIGKLGNAFSGMGEEMKGTLGSIFSGVGGAASSTAEGMNSFLNQLKNSDNSSLQKTFGEGGSLVNKMAAGHRVDFPQVWRNSNYTPSYTATIRLYNPNPGNPKSTKQYIIGPLAAILTLALPRSDDASTYNWPFFHKIKSKGIYNLDPAVITNITVVKGGDQQQIAYNQNLSMVDVRIDFISLYNSILLEETGNKSTNRPTLRTYLKAMESEGNSFKRSQMQEESAKAAGHIPLGNSIITSSSSNEVDTVNEQVAKTQAPYVLAVENSDRMDANTKHTEDYLASLGGMP